MRLPRTIPAALALLMFLLPSAPMRAGEALFPLDAVRPGMRGEWRSVAVGTRVDSFEFEVIGMAESFAGPGHRAVLVKVLDHEQSSIGPVAGMSGSPAYIDGKLVGAMAYGFTWPKDQAIYAIQPIGFMLETLQYPLTSPTFAPPRGEAASRPAAPVAASWRLQSGIAAAAGIAGGSLSLEPLPTPLVAAGVSGDVLKAFAEEIHARGLVIESAPSGRAEPLPEQALTPGMPVAGVLLGGDFQIAATGTLTWRDGERVLAFGHPFLQAGPVEIPMATAEVLTIVQGLPRSFKLSSLGPVVGTFYQDRMPAIAGVIGAKPKTTQLSVQVREPDGSARLYQGELFRSPALAPLIGAIGVMQSLSENIGSDQEQTLHVQGRLQIAGQADIVFAEVSGTPDAARNIALGIMQRLDLILRNPFEPVHIERLHLEVQRSPGYQYTDIERVTLLDASPRAGESVRLECVLRDHLGGFHTQTLIVPLPPHLAGVPVEILIADGPRADAAELGESRDDVDSLPTLLAQLRDRRPASHLYVLLRQTTPGLRISGQALPNLLPSVESGYLSPLTASRWSALTHKTLFEQRVPLRGEFRGEHRLTLVPR